MTQQALELQELIATMEQRRAKVELGGGVERQQKQRGRKTAAEPASHERLLMSKIEGTGVLGLD